MIRLRSDFRIVQILIAALLLSSGCKGTSEPPPPPDVCSAPVLPHWTNNIFPTLFDDFERPDQVGLGTPEEGTSWTLYGPGSVGMARIENGYYTGGPPAPAQANLVYAASFLEGPPEFFGAQFSFITTTNSGGADGLIAIISSSDPPPGKVLWRNMLHLVVSPKEWVLTVYRNGVPHLLKTGTSAGVLPLVADGRQYEIRVQVIGDNVQVYLPNGDVVQACDPDVSDVHGNQLIYEHVYTDQSPHYGRFDLVYGFVEP